MKGAEIMSDKSRRPPDYIVKVMDKLTDAKSGRLGAAWDNADGSISIIMDPGTCLTYGPTLEIRLFTREKAGG